MTLRKSISASSVPPLLFWGGIIMIALLATGLRFWGLDRFNTFVFDEIYFAKFAQNYLTQTPFFDAHPPLGKYVIALGIKLSGFNPWGFRWMNAVVGSCIPLVGMAIAYEISKQRLFSFLTGFLLCLDGLLLVESRYALINIHLLFFGLVGQWCLLKAANVSRVRGVWLTIASLLFGATLSVKWNGLGLLLGFHCLWLFHFISRLVQGRHTPKTYSEDNQESLGASETSSLQNLGRLSFTNLFIYLPLIALGVYGLVWIPHLSQNHDFSLTQLNIEMFKYHAGVGSGIDTHRYCSTWSSWPLMLKPVSYFFQTTQSALEPLPVNGPPLPTGAAKLYTSVYAIGNPILWWTSTLALMGVAVQAITLLVKMIDPTHQQSWPSSARSWVILFIGINYLGNLLPWALISRCAFLYHYMPANFFGVMALAWHLAEFLKSSSSHKRSFAIAVLIICIIGFLFWLPLFLGLPITPEAWRLRIWLRSWI